jgi:HEAT repeat protein
MPKHRKNGQNKKKENKPQMPHPPHQDAEDQGVPEDFDDEVSAAVAAYFSDLGDTDQAAVAAEVRRLLDALGDSFVITGSDDDPDDDPNNLDMVSPGLRPKVPVDQLMQRLIQERELPPIVDLFALSDLTSQDVEVVRQQWELVDVDRRRHVLAELVALQEGDIDLDLVRLLRVAMTDSDAQVRQIAITGLWEDGGVDLLGPLVQFLANDPDEEVRAAAATGLGTYVLAGELDELDSALAMRAEEALLAVLNNEAEPVEVRRRALESIAYSGEAGVRQLIEDGYYAANEGMRVSAVFAMGRSADVRWRGLVRAELRSPSAEMRAEAAISCGELGAKSAADDISALLQDRDERVRLAAILALGRLGGPAAQDALETVLLSDNPIEVQAAEAALEEIQFFDQMDGIELFDETDEEDEVESDARDEEWYDDFDDVLNDDDLGEYEDDDDEH